MRDMRRYKIRAAEFSSRKSKVLSALVVGALIGALGVFSFASQDAARNTSLPRVTTTVIRTTPDAPQEVPPPVEQPKDGQH